MQNFVFSGLAAAARSKIFTRLIRKKLFTFGNERRKWNSEFDAWQAGGGGRQSPANGGAFATQQQLAGKN